MQNTPQQDATMDAMRACDHFPGVWIDRVEADGRYWVKQNNDGNYRLFQDCVAKYRADSSKAQYATAQPKDLVVRAYVIKVTPPTGTLQTFPEPVSQFKADQPATFFLNLYKSGRTPMGKFKWYKPDGTLAAQQDRVLRDSTATSTRTWFTQVLPSVNVQVPGEWPLELTIDDQIIARYPFTVTP
ncbi:MAG: hypothetical protein Q7W02_14210 [Candidatus Rokubacteria bacterium]|nr:hypothetical protein [Candidatus Rokubacteria bacterium]